MTMGKRLITAIIVMLMGAAAAVAQEADTSRWHGSVATGLSVSSGWGRTQSLSWLAPRVSYQATDRLKVGGGFAVAGSLMPAGYALHGREPRSLAPRQQGTQLGAVWAEAEYRVNDRLWVWGSVAKLTGYAQPLWLDGSVPIEATAISGGFAYAIGEGSLLEMHFHFVHDHYGTAMSGLLGYPYYGHFSPEMDIFHGSWLY